MLSYESFSESPWPSSVSQGECDRLPGSRENNFKMGWILSKFRRKKSTLEVDDWMMNTPHSMDSIQELEKIETELNSLGKLKTETLVWQKKVISMKRWMVPERRVFFIVSFQTWKIAVTTSRVQCAGARTSGHLLDLGLLDRCPRCLLQTSAIGQGQKRSAGEWVTSQTEIEQYTCRFFSCPS